MKATKATKATEQLARWFHKAHRKVQGDRGKSLPPWAKLESYSRNNYRAVAEMMLANPPACLREARP